MLSYAELIGWRAENTNPLFRMKRPTLPPRVVVWTPAEVVHFVATADRLDLRSIADAVIVALHTGQRQADVLQLELAHTSGGRAVFRQRKTRPRSRPAWRHSPPATPPAKWLTSTACARAT
jgi:integrase